jgi:hypothetical protein
MIMLIVLKCEEKIFKFSYIKIINLDVVQYVKYDLEEWEVGQYLGGN